jgi:hypothetical protein
MRSSSVMTTPSQVWPAFESKEPTSLPHSTRIIKERTTDGASRTATDVWIVLTLKRPDGPGTPDHVFHACTFAETFSVVVSNLHRDTRQLPV